MNSISISVINEVANNQRDVNVKTSHFPQSSFTCMHKCSLLSFQIFDSHGIVLLTTRVKIKHIFWVKLSKCDAAKLSFHTALDADCPAITKMFVL